MWLGSVTPEEMKCPEEAKSSEGFEALCQTEMEAKSLWVNIEISKLPAQRSPKAWRNTSVPKELASNCGQVP